MSQDYYILQVTSHNYGERPLQSNINGSYKDIPFESFPSKGHAI